LDSHTVETNFITSHIEKSIAVKQQILSDPNLIALLAKAAELSVCTFQKGNKVILAGNGGSAADAQHIAAEFVSRFGFDRPGLPSMSLSTDTSIITAISNDYGYDKLFSRQLKANGRSGDLFIAISTSGNSKNIIEALKTSKELGITSIAFTGDSGGELKQISEYTLCVPSDCTAFIQEAHIMFGHIICGYVEDVLFGEGY